MSSQTGLTRISMQLLYSLTLRTKETMNHSERCPGQQKSNFLSHCTKSLHLEKRESGRKRWLQQFLLLQLSVITGQCLRAHLWLWWRNQSTNDITILCVSATLQTESRSDAATAYLALKIETTTTGRKLCPGIIIFDGQHIGVPHRSWLGLFCWRLHVLLISFHSPETWTSGYWWY